MNYISFKDTKFEFRSSVGEKNDKGFFESEIIGEVPIPKIIKTDRIILPIDEGIAIDADGDYEDGEFSFDSISHHFCGREGTMSMAVIERDKRYLLISLENGVNSSYSLKKENGVYSLSVYNQKPCRVFYKAFDNLITLCKEYKSLKRKKFLTLSEKAEQNAEVEKLFGGAIFWIWNDNYDEIMYSDYDTDKNPQTSEKLIEISRELKQNGIDRAMFGIFFKKDGEYAEKLYKDFGYICTQYDNYSDCLNPERLSIIPNNRVKNCDYTERRMKDYPDGISMDENGNLRGAWALKGFDGKMYSQNRVCPYIGMKRMKEEVPEVLKKYPYYKGRFVDVYGGSIEECFNPKHPVTLEECVKFKKQAFENLEQMGLIAGTEDGFEDIIDSLVYTEGLHSPVYFRNKDSGRRHANMYNEKERKHIEKQMLSPKLRIPLWQMVYHENLLSFPYWGDSTDDSVEQIKDKILFACLFGCPPLYSFSVSDFEKLKQTIVSSYKKISKVNKKTAAEPITDYRVLNDDFTLQQTVFGNKYSVTANFSDIEQYYNGEKIPPKDFVFKTL